MKVSAASNVVASPAKFWVQSYGAASIVFGITMLEFAILAGAHDGVILPSGLILFGLSVLLGFSRLYQWQVVSKVCALTAFGLMLGASDFQISESQLPWVSFITLLCVASLVRNSAIPRRQCVGAICAWICLLLSIYSLGVADLSDLSLVDVRFWIVAWCSVAPFAFLAVADRRTAPKIAQESNLLVASAFLSLPLCYFFLRILGIVAGVDVGPTNAACTLAVCLAVAFAINNAFLSRVEACFHQTNRELEAKLAYAESSAKKEAQIAAQTIRDLSDQVEMKHAALAILSSEVERSRQMMLPVVSAATKLHELRDACTEIDEIAALLKHRNEYDSFEPNAQDAGDFSITYFRTQVYNALELFGNRTRNILVDLESIMPNENQGKRSA